MAQTTATPQQEEWVPADSFGGRLVLLRQAMGNISITAISARCGLDDGSWSNWERGTRPRDFEAVVDKIVKATGVHRMWLAFGLSAVGGSEKRGNSTRRNRNGRRGVSPGNTRPGGARGPALARPELPEAVGF